MFLDQNSQSAQSDTPPGGAAGEEGGGHSPPSVGIGSRQAVQAYPTPLSEQLATYGDKILVPHSWSQLKVQLHTGLSVTPTGPARQFAYNPATGELQQVPNASESGLVLRFICVFCGVQPPEPGDLRVFLSKCAGRPFQQHAIVWPGGHYRVIGKALQGHREGATRS